MPESRSKREYAEPRHAAGIAHRENLPIMNSLNPGRKEAAMPLSEQSMQFLEEHIPELAQSAVTQAYWQALAAGNSVLQCDNGAIYEVFPDGTRTLVKTVTPPTAVTPGETRALR
jgi:hypothetical protein